MATEYLVFHGIWHIARAGAIQDDTDDCPKCGNTRVTCVACAGSGRIKIDDPKDRPYRLAWFGRDNGFICFDYNRPEVRSLD